MTKLKKLILQRGLKQNFIADKIGLECSVVSRFVTGKREISDEWASKIARVLGVEISKIK
jgi:plasmid maintenance system antidote protein VapI